MELPAFERLKRNVEHLDRLQKLSGCPCKRQSTVLKTLFSRSDAMPIKLLFLGDGGVGKSSIMYRFVVCVLSFFQT